MDYEEENAKLRACLREIYRTFQYGPGASSSQAPFIMKMVVEALGWPVPPMGGGSGPPANFGGGISTTVSNGSNTWGGMAGGGGGANGGGSTVAYGVGGSAAGTMEERVSAWAEQAKREGRPVSIGAGAGGGQPWRESWMFPDGTVETLPGGEKPVWPKSEG